MDIDKCVDRIEAGISNKGYRAIRNELLDWCSEISTTMINAYKGNIGVARSQKVIKRIESGRSLDDGYRNIVARGFPKAARQMIFSSLDKETLVKSVENATKILDKYLKSTPMSDPVLLCSVVDTSEFVTKYRRFCADCRVAESQIDAFETGISDFGTGMRAVMQLYVDVFNNAFEDAADLVMWVLSVFDGDDRRVYATTEKILCVFTACSGKGWFRSDARIIRNAISHSQYVVRDSTVQLYNAERTYSKTFGIATMLSFIAMMIYKLNTAIDILLLYLSLTIGQSLVTTYRLPGVVQ